MSSEIIPSQKKCCHESNMLRPENQNNQKSMVHGGFPSWDPKQPKINLQKNLLKR
jgi:hypothetical protein